MSDILAFTPSLVNIFLNNLAPNVPINKPRNPPFCSFGSFLILLPAPFYQ